MKRTLKPKKGNLILLVETYVKAKNSDFESVSGTIYYVDKKRQKIWKEDGFETTSLLKYKGITTEPNVEYYHSYARGVKSRSIKKLVESYHKGFKSFESIFSDFDIQISEIGTL